MSEGVPGKQSDANGVPPQADLPEDLAADFVPLKEAGGNAALAEAQVDPYQRDSLHAEEAFERAVGAAAAGDTDRAVQEYLRAAKIAEIAREWYVAAVSLRRVGEFLEHARPPLDLERAFRMHRRAVAAYERCGLFAEARGLTYRLLWVKLRRARELNLPWWQRLELLAYWATAGFGQRPLRVIGTACAVILLYGVLYWALGGVVPARAQEPVGIWQALYFSGVTFATVGYGDFVPAPHARLLALTEGMLGAFTMGFFVVVLSNRLRH